MPSRLPLLSMLLLVFSSALCDAQTATCTNWKFFDTLPSPWINFGTGGINRWGTVVGAAAQQSTGSPTVFGFVRYSNGGFKTFRVPNASVTFFSRRNALGVTVGRYTDTSATPHTHGLVVSGSSTATIDYPGAPITALSGINYWGTIVGNYQPSPSIQGGAFRLKNRVFTPIVYPGSASTGVSSISDKGVIVGTYYDSVAYYPHGYVLQNGVYVTLDNPKADPEGGTILTDINGSGVIAGYYYIGSIAYSFIYVNGVFKDIAPPNHNYTIVTGINGYGDVVGTTAPNSGGNPGGATYFTVRCQ